MSPAHILRAIDIALSHRKNEAAAAPGDAAKRARVDAMQAKRDAHVAKMPKVPA